MTPSPDIKSFYVSPSALLTRKYSVVKMKYRIVECEGVKTLIIPCRSGVTEYWWYVSSSSFSVLIVTRVINKILSSSPASSQTDQAECCCQYIQTEKYIQWKDFKSPIIHILSPMLQSHLKTEESNWQDEIGMSAIKYQMIPVFLLTSTIIKLYYVHLLKQPMVRHLRRWSILCFSNWLWSSLFLKWLSEKCK